MSTFASSAGRRRATSFAFLAVTALLAWRVLRPTAAAPAAPAVRGAPPACAAAPPAAPAAPPATSCAAAIAAGTCVSEAAWRLEKGRNSLYVADATFLAKFLARYLGADFSPAPAYWAVDVGANIGQTAAQLLAAFTRLPCDALGKVRTTDCYDGVHGVRETLSVEPVPANFDFLVKEGARLGWGGVGWRAVRAAASDTDAGAGVIFGDAEEGNQQPSLAAGAGRGRDGASSPVDVLTIATLAARELTLPAGDPASVAFLLKVDAEGHDPQVLRGAEPLLAGRRVKFVMFEVNDKWHAAGTGSLLGVVKWLHGLRMGCAFVTHEALLPLSGAAAAPWHDRAVELSNVVCGRDEDADWHALLRDFSRPTALAADAGLMGDATACVVAAAPGGAADGVADGGDATATLAALADVPALWRRYLECVDA